MSEFAAPDAEAKKRIAEYRSLHPHLTVLQQAVPAVAGENLLEASD